MMEQKNYISNQSASTEQSLNTSNQNLNNSLYNNKINGYYSNIPLNYIKNNQKIIQNKLIPQKESVYYIYQQQNQINNKYNEPFNSNITNKFTDDSSFYSQKPVKIFNLNLNINNNNNNNNKLNNIINIDNKSSAFELCFISQKKPKQIYKSKVVYQIGPEQQPLSFAFLSEKNKINNYNENKYNINIQNNNSINDLNIKNSSFISNKQFENNNSSFIENETNYSNNVSNRKNELKIMQNPGRKSENKPKPVLQIMSSGNNNKNNIIKKLSESNPHVEGFSLEDNNNDLLKNNFVNVSKSASIIVNNNNQDMSFISNSKEAENLLEINNTINIDNNLNYNKTQKEKNIYGMNNGILFGNQIENSNIYKSYIMINEQLCFISDKINKNNKSNISINDSFNKKSAKKYIKFEYYDSMPVYFDILPEIDTKEKIEIKNKMINEYKMHRVEEMNYINIKGNKNIDDSKDYEDKSIDKEENKSFNNNNKKKRKRKKKK